MKDNKMNRWLVVFGAVLIQLNLGSIFAWSVFTPELSAAGWSKMQTQVAFAVGLASFATVMVWAGGKLAAWGPRTLIWLGGFVLGCGYLLAGLIGGTSFWAITLCVGLIGGAGIGLGYVVPIAVGMRWFPDKKGLITGLSVAGFGFGAMVWVKLAGSWGGLLAHQGLSATFAIYGTIFMTAVFIGGFFMSFPPAGWKPDGWLPSAVAPTKWSAPAVDFSRSEMLQTPQFYLIAFAFLVCTGAGLMSIGLMKLYPMEALQAAGHDPQTASTIAGTAMAVFFSPANGLGRIIWGMASDHLGLRALIRIMSISQGIVLVAFTFMAGNEFLLYLGAALIGFNFGGTFSLFPAMTADTFGTRNVGQNYPFVFFFYGIGGIIFPIAGGLLGDLGNFPLAFFICSTACFLGVAAITLVRPIRQRTTPPNDREQQRAIRIS